MTGATAPLINVTQAKKLSIDDCSSFASSTCGTTKVKSTTKRKRNDDNSSTTSPPPKAKRKLSIAEISELFIIPSQTPKEEEKK